MKYVIEGKISEIVQCAVGLFPKVDSTKSVRKLRSLRISIVFLKIRYIHTNPKFCWLKESKIAHICWDLVKGMHTGARAFKNGGHRY